MYKKYFFVLIVLLFAALIFTYGQNDPWSSENIKSLTADDIINDPVNARKHWSELSQEQKDLVYSRQDGLKIFSQEFAKEKGIASLDLTNGKTIYEGTNLINGNSKVSVLALKNAEVIALKDGGFKIKFPSDTDLSNVEFYGGNFGISFEGQNLKFDEGILSSGAVTIYNENHLRIEPNSVFEANNVKFATGAESFDLYYGLAQQQSNFIQIDKFDEKIRIVGDGLTADFLDENQFKELSDKDATTIKNDDFVLEFDGQGNAYQNIPIINPNIDLTVIDENAPDKKYVLNAEDELVEDDGFLEGYGGCGGIDVVGFVIVDITGRASQDICKGNLVKTGKNLRENKYEAELYLNDDQVKKVREQFISKFGREPNLNYNNDLKELGKLINEQIIDLKFKQTFLADNPYPGFMVKLGLRSWIEKAGLDLSTLTPSENNGIDALAKIVTNIKKGDVLEFQVSGDNGLVNYYPKNGAATSVQVSGRLAKAYMQNYYDENINNVKGQSKDILNYYFGTPKVAAK